MGNSGWPGKTRLGNAACCLLLLGTLVSQEKSCRLLLLSYSCWWGILVGEKKTRLGNDAFHCLLLLGTVVSQKNCCRMLLRVCSCWWGILVGQEKLGWWMPLVACCCWEPSLARKNPADCCFCLIDADEESWLARKKLGWEMTLFIACCCWEQWSARKTAAECCCVSVAADGESWLARKN